MRLTTEVVKMKDARGRIQGHAARLADLGSGTHSTPAEAEQELRAMIERRCSYQSATVKIATARGHVGVFSFDVSGYVTTQHVWPDGHCSRVSGRDTMAEAERGWRAHVAQTECTADDDDGADVLAGDEKQMRDLAEHKRWQARAVFARDVLKLDSSALHQWACYHTHEQYLQAKEEAANV